jgi:4-alpha-glucanotransferase
MGDFRDLRDFARYASKELRCNFILSNPLGASTPLLPQQSSPYFPGSRCFWNPLYLRIDDIPGANRVHKYIAKLARAGCALNERRLIERDKIFRLKMSALEKIWRGFDGNRDFDDFCKQQGKPLKDFAAFCGLAEHFKSGWHKWPKAFRRPDSLAVAKFALENSTRIEFYQWLQWLLNVQLARAGKELPIMQEPAHRHRPGRCGCLVLAGYAGSGCERRRSSGYFQYPGTELGVAAFHSGPASGCGVRAFSANDPGGHAIGRRIAD